MKIDIREGHLEEDLGVPMDDRLGNAVQSVWVHTGRDLMVDSSNLSNIHCSQPFMKADQLGSPSLPSSLIN